MSAKTIGGYEFGYQDLRYVNPQSFICIKMRGQCDKWLEVEMGRMRCVSVRYDGRSMFDQCPFDRVPIMKFHDIEKLDLCTERNMTEVF